MAKRTARLMRPTSVTPSVRPPSLTMPISFSAAFESQDRGLARQRAMVMSECEAQLTLARVLAAVEGATAEPAIEAALQASERLIAETGARIYEPALYEERARLARLAGECERFAEAVSRGVRVVPALPAGEQDGSGRSALAPVLADLERIVGELAVAERPEADTELRRRVVEDPAWWREVYLLAVGKARQGGLPRAVSAVRALLAGRIAGADPDLAHRLAALAGEALVELRLDDGLCWKAISEQT